MSHLVALAAPQPAAHTVKRYAGFGILGADIPVGGDSGGSPVLNDGIAPSSEYHWRVVTPPGSGTLTIHPDLSFDLDGAADGDWSWQYRLFEDGTDQGVATVSIHVGAYAVTVADSQQLNTASAAAIRQTHLLGIASSQQANQANAATIRQTHLVGVANSQQVNTGIAASISQSSITFVAAADSQQINTASAAAILQTHLIGVPNSQQINTAIAAAISTGGFTGSLSDADIARIVAALPSAADIAAAVLAALNATTGARTVGQHLQIQTAVLVGETSGAGTPHIAFIDGSVTVEADVPVVGQTGDRKNVVIGGV